jgi:hypothetical protein
MPSALTKRRGHSQHVTPLEKHDLRELVALLDEINAALEARQRQMRAAAFAEVALWNGR